MTTSSLSRGARGSLGVAARPSPLLAGVGQGAGDWERGRRARLSRYLLSPPRIEASLWNACRPEHCPLVANAPGDEANKSCFPSFLGVGAGWRAGELECLELYLGLYGRVWTGCCLCVVGTKKFAGFRMVMSLLMPTFEILSILFTLQGIVPWA